MKNGVALAQEDSEIQACYKVMLELRPHVGPDEFLSRVRQQQKIAGYQLAYAFDGDVKAVAGFRISECLAWGKFLYVDDLVTAGRDRSRGYGGTLFDWLVAYAKESGCDEFHLDSGPLRIVFI